MEKRVLVVDDENVIVEGLMALLDFEKIENAGASDRISATKILQSRHFPVIVTDLCLHSHAEGLLLLDAIRELSPNSRVVVITGFATPEMVAEVESRGVTLVLQKPLDDTVLLSAIADLMEELERAAAQQSAPLDLEQLYVSAHKTLYSIPTRRYRLPPDVAEDLVQQAWMLFLEKAGYITSAKAWLAGTVANLSRQKIDRLSKHREVGDDEMTVMADERYRDPALRLALETAMSRVDERSRALVILIGVEGESYATASARTGLPLGSIGPMYIRAKKKLREALEH